MEVSVESTEGLNRRVKVQIPETVIRDQIEQKLKELARGAHIPGFRRGKVPLKIIRQRFGHDVRQEVLGEKLESSFKTALREHALNPVGQPTVDIIEDAEDLCYTATFEVFPDINLEQLDAMPIELPMSSVEESDIERMIESLRNQKGRNQTVEGAAKSGDILRLTVTEAATGAAPADGYAGQLCIQAGETHLTLGSTHCPALEQALAAAQPGASHTLELPWLPDKAQPPADAASPADAEAMPDVPSSGAAPSELTFQVAQIKEWVLPELDAAFIADYGVEDGTLASLRADLRQHMERSLANRLATITKEQVVTAIEGVKVDIPEALLKEKLGALHGIIAKAGQSVDGRNPDPAKATSPFMEQTARHLVVRDLIMSAIVESGKVSLDEQRLRDEIAVLASTYEDAEAFERFIHSNREKYEEFANRVLEQQIVEWIVERAEVTKVPLPLQDLTQYRNPLTTGRDAGDTDGAPDEAHAAVSDASQADEADESETPSEADAPSPKADPASA